MNKKEKQILTDFLSTIASSVATRSYDKEADPEGYAIDEQEATNFNKLCDIIGKPHWKQ